MLEIEAKRKLKPSEGAHLLYTMIFLISSTIIKSNYSQQKCGLRVSLFVNIVFYGMLLWLTFILITMVQRIKNPIMKIFFNFLDISFGIYILALTFYATLIYLNNT